LKEIFITSQWNERVFEILESKITEGKKRTGRPGMDLWQIFVLSQVRLCQNISYDDLHHIANNDHLIRQTVMELNQVIVEFGHEVFKKKEVAALCLKTDSFVVESNVHFPTDYNLLWDSARKCLDMVGKFVKKYPEVPGWRKIRNWRNEMKSMMRAVGKASSSGGKGKEQRIKKAVRSYLLKARVLQDKLEGSKEVLPQRDITDLLIMLELDRFIGLLSKHIDLLERRLIKGEQIPHDEKLFSIFEDYTEWITKGKLHPNVELGKKLAITTDQFNLIVDYRIMDQQSDSEIVKPLAERLTGLFPVKSWSFDKGFWHKDNKALLEEHIEKVIMPKKGKCNKQEQEEEGQRYFKRLRNMHSAVESNINELECRGLDRCPDRGYPNFKRYVGLAVAAYNLRRIGNELITVQRQALQSTDKEYKTAA
jgi:IS5 family transposase